MSDEAKVFLTGLLIASAVMLAMIKGARADDTINAEGIMESAHEDCLSYADIAMGIQMIRADTNDRLETILATLQASIAEEFEEGYKRQPIYILQVREIGLWVYKNYPDDFDPILVGSTYMTECEDKTYASIQHAFPDIAGTGSKKEQLRKAWELVQ